jgi:phosphatidylglycerol lysyltransferase
MGNQTMTPETATGAPPSAGQAGTLPGGVGRQWLRNLLAHFRAIPFTLGVLAVFLVTGAVTGSFLSGPPEQLLDVASVSAPGLKTGRWWSLFTSMFFATNLLAYFSASLMILLLLGLAERRLGSRRTAVFFFAGQFVAVSLFLLLTQLAHYAGDGWLGLMVDAGLIGPYAAVVAVSLASSGLQPTLCQRRLRTALISG